MFFKKMHNKLDSIIEKQLEIEELLYKLLTTNENIVAEERKVIKATSTVLLKDLLNTQNEEIQKLIKKMNIK